MVSMRSRQRPEALKRRAHKISFLIAYAQMPLINAHVNVSSEARSLNVGLSRYLHLYFCSLCMRAAKDHKNLCISSLMQ